MSARERCHWHRVDSFASYFASYAKICHKTCLLKKKTYFACHFHPFVLAVTFESTRFSMFQQIL